MIPYLKRCDRRASVARISLASGDGLSARRPPRFAAGAEPRREGEERASDRLAGQVPPADRLLRREHGEDLPHSGGVRRFAGAFDRADAIALFGCEPEGLHDVRVAERARALRLEGELAEAPLLPSLCCTAPATAS